MRRGRHRRPDRGSRAGVRGDVTTGKREGGSGERLVGRGPHPEVGPLPAAQRFPLPASRNKEAPMPERKVLTQIAPIAWEHPADRAALNTLRGIPGFDELVRKVLGFFGERGIRHLFLANAVKIGPRQRPKLNALFTEVLETLDWPERPELYVTQTPDVNAGAVGFEKPFIILNSGTLGLLEREEQRTVLGHELGHVMSGHATYRTIALILLTVGVRNLPFLAGMALLPIELALFEWFRKSELSCDRAGLLSGQDPQAAMRTELKLAGGGVRMSGLATGEEDEINLEEFLIQAEEYEAGGNAI